MISICVKFQNLIDVFVQNILLQKLKEWLTSKTNKHKNLNLHNKADIYLMTDGTLPSSAHTSKL